MNQPRIALNLSEWESLAPAPGSAVSGLALSDSAAQRVAADLSRGGMLVIEELRSGLRIQASSFVGRVQVGDLQVTVRPKIDQMRLLRLLRYAYKLRDLRLYERVGYDAAADTFPDLLIRQLAVEVEELLARGLRRTYVQVHEELGSPRGRIDIQSLARNGGLTRAALPCIHHPRSEDIVLNRTVLAGLRLAIRVTNESALRVTLHRLAATLAGGVSTARLDLASSIGRSARCPVLRWPMRRR